MSRLRIAALRLAAPRCGRQPLGAGVAAIAACEGQLSAASGWAAGRKCPQLLLQQRGLPLPSATATSCRRALPHAARLLFARHAAGAWRRASTAAVARSLRSKETPKTGDHGGIMRQPQRNRSIPKAYAKQYLLGEGHRALRAPASASVPRAGSQVPGVKSCGGSLRLCRCCRLASPPVPSPVPLE